MHCLSSVPVMHSYTYHAAASLTAIAKILVLQLSHASHAIIAREIDSAYE